MDGRTGRRRSCLLLHPGTQGVACGAGLLVVGCGGGGGGWERQLRPAANGRQSSPWRTHPDIPLRPASEEFLLFRRKPRTCSSGRSPPNVRHGELWRTFADPHDLTSVALYLVPRPTSSTSIWPAFRSRSRASS